MLGFGHVRPAGLLQFFRPAPGLNDLGQPRVVSFCQGVRRDSVSVMTP
ncbi:MAG: hypothetical protein M3P31_06670 [Actinomycetota bacterium]|nr:hypothetical protein [Actinomycetota bacterium]